MSRISLDAIARAAREIERARRQHRPHLQPHRPALRPRLGGQPEPRPGLGRQLEIYRRYASELLGGRAHPVLAHAFEWLGRESGADGTIVPSWGDARIGNMIFRDFGCVAVNDWEAAALGPAELDLGWWLMFDRMSFDDMGATRMEGFPTREEMISIYAEVSGREVRMVTSTLGVPPASAPSSQSTRRACSAPT